MKSNLEPYLSAQDIYSTKVLTACLGDQVLASLADPGEARPSRHNPGLPPRRPWVSANQNVSFNQGASIANRDTYSAIKQDAGIPVGGQVIPDPPLNPVGFILNHTPVTL